MNILITGCAGFIGFHLVKKLLSKKNKIYGIDNCNNFYNNGLKQERLKILNKISINKKYYFKFFKFDISSKKKIDNFFKKFKIDIVIHLAAQAGVRFSISKPELYLKSNIGGYLNILEAAKKNKINKIIYASSSSVYGNNKKKPFSEKDVCENPLQFYAVTKLTNEYMSKVYAYLYNIKFIGLRFFTVYGPYGRPDMALFKFTKNIINNKNIHFFSSGSIKRDFTYIDDVIVRIEGLIKKFKNIKTNHEIFNIGNGKPKKLELFLKKIKKNLKKKARLKKFKEKKEDSLVTFSDSKKIDSFLKLSKKTNLKKGIRLFINWYKAFYNKN